MTWSKMWCQLLVEPRTERFDEGTCLGPPFDTALFCRAVTDLGLDRIKHTAIHAAGPDRIESAPCPIIAGR